MQCKSVTRPMLNYIKESTFDFLSVGYTLAVDKGFIFVHQSPYDEALQIIPGSQN
jgi:hypothetical protein